MDFEETCKTAADHLGLRFMGATWTPREDRPAGCFWRSDGTVEFNKMVDPLKTNPEEFHEYGKHFNVMHVKKLPINPTPFIALTS